MIAVNAGRWDAGLDAARRTAEVSHAILMGRAIALDEVRGTLVDAHDMAAAGYVLRPGAPHWTPDAR